MFDYDRMARLGWATVFAIPWFIAIAWFIMSPNHAYIGCGENIAVGICCRGLWIAVNGNRVGRGASEQKRTLSPTRRLKVPPDFMRPFVRSLRLSASRHS